MEGNLKTVLVIVLAAAAGAALVIVPCRTAGISKVLGSKN